LLVKDGCDPPDYAKHSLAEKQSSRRSGGFRQLLDNVEFDLCDTAFNHPKGIGRGM
jgi:hypothetical protein